jgi:hypothetical protein
MPDAKEQKIVFVEAPPNRYGGGMFGRWMRQLSPLLDHPNRWALIYTCESPTHANKLQSNLHARQVLIPEPNHVWEFAARGNEVYAVYRGKPKPVRKRMK